MYNLENVETNLLGATKNCSVCSSGANHENKVCDSILDSVGNTPLVRLKKTEKDHGLSCEIYAKCEFLNPGGSIKDRIGLSMVRDAQDAGLVHDDTIFVEPTSGNTGIAIALNATLIEKACTIVMGEKNSNEKVSTMRSLGAEVITVKGDAEEVAKQLKKDDPDRVLILNQYENMVNPMTHFQCTGMEIISALDKVDAIVLGAGTGGTLSGVAHRLKQKFPECIVVAAEPDGSVLINTNGHGHPFLIEGVGKSSPLSPTPSVLDKSMVDRIEVVTDEEAFLTARELTKREGLLCGGSSGMAMCAALKAAKALKLEEGKRMVVILPDGTRNYMSKFVTDQWMEAHLFMDPPQRDMNWWNNPITDVKLTHKYPLLKENVTCEVAFNSMKDSNIAVIVKDNGHFLGAVTKDNFRNAATNPSVLAVKNNEEFNFNDLATKHLVKDCYTLAENGKKGMPTIGLLSRILDITPFVIIGIQGKAEKDYFVPRGVVTGDDVLGYIHDMKDSNKNKIPALE